MIVRDALTLANQLVSEHLDSSWSVKIGRSDWRAGWCNYRTKTIGLSGLHVEQYSAKEVRDVILHEIAHALAGPEAAHGPVWKQTARALGGSGREYVRPHQSVPMYFVAVVLFSVYQGLAASWPIAAYALLAVAGIWMIQKLYRRFAPIHRVYNLPAS